MWEMWILPEKEAFREEKKSTNLYTKLNVYFCSKNPYEPFLCGCYGNVNRICIATTNELFEKHMFVFRRDVQYRNI